MSLASDHIPFQHAQDSDNNETLPPLSKRRRLNGTPQNENECGSRYDGSTILRDSSRAHFGNVYETHNHFASPSPQAEQAKSKHLIESLAFKRMDARLHNVKAALKNTCDWLFRHHAFKEWMDDAKLSEHKGFLWIKGKPGCGKSTLMKGACQWAKARAKRQWITLSYFFNARAPGVLEKSPLGLYRSLVHEILRVVPRSADDFDEMFSWKDNSDDVEWTVEELQGFLVKFVEADWRPPALIFIDALDEGDEFDIRALVGFLEDLTEHTRQDLPLRICLSSRHYPHITIRTGLSLIVEQQTEHDRDIDRYVRQKLVSDADAELAGLRATICERAAGVFLWIVLVVPILNLIHDRGKSVADMVACLARLPKDLEGLFAEILARDATEARSCVSLLQWVLYSNTPLGSVELYLAIQHSWFRSDEDVVVVPAKGQLDKYLLQHSRGLVEITKSEPPVIQFIHETVREFLAGKHGLAQVDPALEGNLLGWSHARLAQTCLSYLCQNCSESTLSPYRERLAVLRGKVEREAARREWIPFLSYTVANLLVHAEAAQRHGISQESLLKMLQTSDGRLHPDFLFAYNFCQKHAVRRYNSDVTMLYVVAEKCLPSLVSLVLSLESSPINSTCGRYGNALQAACCGGNEEVVRSLLEHGADVNRVGGEHKSALGAVVTARNFSIFEILKAHGLEKRSLTLTTILSWLHGENLKVVADLKEVFDRGIHKYLQSSVLDVALAIAAEVPHIEAMKMLLQNGAHVNSQFTTRTPSLSNAVVSGSVEAVELLLDRGAVINPDTGLVGNAMHHACWSGHEKIVQAFLNHGADIDAIAGPCGNVLHTAVACDRQKIVRMLLDMGANIDASGVHGTALYEAARRGYEEMVSILLDRGADVSARGPSGATPLQTASFCDSYPRGQYVKVVKLLLDEGADVNAEGPFGTALDVALGTERPAIAQDLVELLLSRGAKRA